MNAKIDALLSRWELIRARLDGFVLSRAVEHEPLWWDVILDGADDGSFVDEVNERRNAPKTGPIMAPFSNLEGEPESYDTGKWIEKFYGKPLEIEGFMTTSLETKIETVTDVTVRKIGPYTLLKRLGAGG